MPWEIFRAKSFGKRCEAFPMVSGKATQTCQYCCACNLPVAVKAKHEQVEPLELLKALEPVGPASPIEKGAIACFSPSVLDVEHKYLVLCIRVYVE